MLTNVPSLVGTDVTSTPCVQTLKDPTSVAASEVMKEMAEPAQVKLILRPFLTALETKCGRSGGLLVSALDSGSRGPGSSPGRVIVLCSWARHFTFTVPLSTQEYKWVPANCQENLTKYW